MLSYIWNILYFIVVIILVVNTNKNCKFLLFIFTAKIYFFIILVDITIYSSLLCCNYNIKRENFNIYKLKFKSYGLWCTYRVNLNVNFLGSYYSIKSQYKIRM